MARRRVGVLISGGGSNLQALLDATAAPDSPASIVLVVSNVAGAFGLSRAERAGVPAHCLDHRRFLDRATFDAALDRLFRESGVDLVCLAGFMRILSADFVERWRDRLLNIHPSLLPAFPGLHTHARVLASGVRIHGCTVHLVRPALDDGPILVQGVVPVLDGDDAVALAARVLEVEHRCYPLALREFTAGRLAVEGERVRGGECRLILHPSLAGG
jgi:phosphoribosylglycinamide formyltransferase 1